MCNIAGYVGGREAAPILIEMIARQEGLNGGFFTGLAVHSGTVLDYRKTEGGLNTLLTRTDAASLRGRTGIMHSRTPSGGDGSWAHPFSLTRNGEVEMCYVANGAAGMFQKNNAAYNAIADRLIADGFDIPCKLSYTGDKYSRLSTGETVHMSDVMCQLIGFYRARGEETARAMTHAFCEMPSEIVGLAVTHDATDRICYSRINMPMFVGFDPSGAYLASSPMAFPSSVTSYELLPALSSGRIFCDHVETEPYEAFPTEVSDFDQTVIDRISSWALSLMREEEQGAKDLIRALRDRMPKDRLAQADAMVYLALCRLWDGECIASRAGSWTVHGKTAPKIYFRAKQQFDGEGRSQS